jgi:hypothetical protein
VPAPPPPMPPPPSPPPPSPPPPIIEFDFDNNETDVNHIIYHDDDSLIVFNGAVRPCDLVIFVRKDYTDDLDDKWQTCDIAPHLFTLSQHSNPPEYGGRVYNTRPDLGGAHVEAVLHGVRDSSDYLAADPALQDTGTYSVRPAHRPKSQTDASLQTHLATPLAALPCKIS